MRFLLIGEYSNVHATLARSLRRLGHEVLVISDGDGWKDYPRDIDISRHADTRWETLRLMTKLMLLLPRLRGWDVVQVINPYFVYLNPQRNLWLWHYLKRHNGKMSVGLFGDDYQVMAHQHEVLKYSDTYIGNQPIATDLNHTRIPLWTEIRRELCETITAEADYLVAGLYEYWKCYDFPAFRDRLHYIGYPIERPITSASQQHNASTASDSPKSPVHILIGVQKKRMQIKGTDQMLPLLRRLAAEYPDQVVLNEVENVPFVQYQKLLRETDVLVDQLYSYTPAMNALEAMKNGTIVVSGGEEDFYHFIGEQELRPIINLQPGCDDKNYEILKETILNPERLQQMSHESRLFIERHHEAESVAQQYLKLFR